MDALTLDQFAVFAVVVEEGSFAAAARRMNRAQSAITYAIQKLEEQSGLPLFDRSSYRPALTKAGEALLPRARRILSDLDEYRLHARQMTMGLEHEVSIAVHPYVSPGVLSAALIDFNQEFPSVRINTSLCAKHEISTALRNGDKDLAIVLELTSLGEGLEHRVCTQFEIVVAAAPAHPLAQVNGAFQVEALRDHRRLVMRAVLTEEEVSIIHGYGMDGPNFWEVMDFETTRNMLLAGLGWSALPRFRIEGDIAAGRLTVLRAQEWGNAENVLRVELAVARSAHRPAGPAARWLFERLAAEGAAWPADRHSAPVP